MVSMAETEVNLFGEQLPSLDAIKKLSNYVNSHYLLQNEFAQQVEANQGNKLAAGIGYYLLGQPAKAVELLSKSADCKEKYIYLANAFARLENYDVAIENLDKAARHNADSLMVALEKASVYRKAGNFEAADKELSACSNFEKVSADYHYQLGKLCDARGQYQKALKNYDIAVNLDPGHYEALFQLAYTCDLRSDEELAVEYYRQIAKCSPVYVNALLNLAVICEDNGDYENAAAYVDAVLKSHPNNQKAQLFAKDIESSKSMIYDEDKERRQDRQNKILEIPISDFELSVRSRNCLKKMNIHTLGDLLRISEAELLSYKNFGETSLMEIKKILDSKNLRLGMALEDKTASYVAEAVNVQGADEGLINKTVEELELSVRARRCLSRLNIRTFGELIGKTEAELLGCKNFGVTSLNEIKERLTNFGLNLRKLE